MARCVKLLAGLAGIGAVAGVVAVSGVASADVAPKPSGDARVPAVQAATVGPDAAAAPKAGTVKIKGQYQHTKYYCVPASSSISLRTLGAKVSQKNLAKQMKTTPSGGTSGKNATPVLNKYAKSKGYRYGYANVSSGTRMLSAVGYDVGTLKRATLLGVWMEKLPWNKGKVSGKKVGHAIVVYGYSKSKKTVSVWDPWKPTGGRHKISASKLAATAQPNGLHYISR